MTNSIGQSLPRIDAQDKATGTALYSGDLIQPEMLHMKILFAGRPHARVISIDTSVARALPGVAMVLTAIDVPINEYGLQKKDQPVLCGPTPLPVGNIPEDTRVKGDTVRCEGDQVAAVIAETEALAAKARDLIKSGIR